MEQLAQVTEKIYNWSELSIKVKLWQLHHERVVFTNGCFDLIHKGHLTYLANAKSLGNRLIIGLNSDASVKRLKGAHRPIKDQETRSLLLAALSFVDGVALFEEDTPLDLISTILPDILVKGGDWTPDKIIGADVVIANGGKVLSLPYIEGHSTTSLESKIKHSS